MRVIRGLYNLPDLSGGSVISIGAFDGLHLGHQSLLQPLMRQARELQVPSVLITFEPLPREYFSQRNAPSRLMNFREKAEACAVFGIDYILCLRFNEQIRAMSAEDFVEHVFVEGLHARHITIGDDFRFGHDRSGDQQLLERLQAKFGFEVDDTSSVLVGSVRISSTKIRACLEAGDFDAAEKMLGRPYSMSGKVVYGRQLGRTLGFPTANVHIKRHKSAMSGVYIVEARLADGRRIEAIANVGTRPTIGDRLNAVLEVHLFDFKDNIYGKRLDVRFLHKIRDERKFESLESLKQAIASDVANARQWFAAKADN